MPARFISLTLPAPSETFRLDGAEGHHLSRVLRVRTGELVEGLDGKGSIWRSRVVETDKSGVLLQGEETEQHPAPIPELGMAVALLKPQAMEWVVQKAVELGVTCMYPVVTDRSVARLSKDRELRWVERTDRVVDAALKQCGRAWRPSVHAPMAWKDFLNLPVVGRKLMANLDGNTVLLPEALEGAEDGATLLVGPEGDFSEKERLEAREAGWLSVSLGDAVLRAETAVLYGLSAMVYTLRRETT